MHFICLSTDLMEGLSTVSHALSAKNTLPILDGIYIEARGEQVRLVATDTITTIETRIDAHIFEGGAAVLPGRLLHDIVRRLPDGEVDCEMDGSQVTMQCKGSRMTLQTMPTEEYPPIGGAEGQSVTLKQAVLRDIIRGTVFAVAVDETRPILTGCLFELEEDALKVIALDGFRFAMRKYDFEEGVRYLPASMIAPGKMLNDLSRILADEGDVNVIIGKNHAMFDMGNTRVIARLLEGEFINYRQIIPQGQKIHIKTERAALEECLDRASLMARAGKNNLVRMNISDDQMVITSNSETGNIRESLPIQLHGDELGIAFNVRFLSDIIKAIDADDITMHFDNNVSPCLVQPITGDAFLYLLLPVRVSA